MKINFYKLFMQIFFLENFLFVLKNYISDNQYVVFFFWKTLLKYVVLMLTKIFYCYNFAVRGKPAETSKLFQNFHIENNII